MRIGLVSYDYPPQQSMGGVGTYMFRLAGALGRAGHEVHVITGPSDRAPVQQPNVILHRIEAEFEPQTSRLTRWLYWHAIAEPMGRCNPIIWHWLRWNLASHEAIRRMDAGHPFDVVEAPEHAANGWMAGRIHTIMGEGREAIAAGRRGVALAADPVARAWRCGSSSCS